MGYRAGGEPLTNAARVGAGQLADANISAPSPSTRLARRYAVITYWGGSIILVPWIIGLMIAQANTDGAYHRSLISFGLLLLFAAGAVATGILCQRRSNHALIAATFTATLIFVAAWFSFLAVHPPANILVKGRIFLVILLALPTGLMLWVAVRILRSLDSRWSAPRWVAVACFLFPALIVPWLAARLTGASSVLEAHRMRVAWTGLDVVELAAMLATGFAIRRGSPWMALSASVVGGLLCCDVWFNVLSASGADLALGIALAFIELPLAIYSFALAAREVRGWSPPSSSDAAWGKEN